jgi:Sec-independent protein translocase protein TatA
MFGIGFSEIVIVFLAVIIFVRPADLPKFLRTAGRLYGKAKKAYNELAAVKDRIIQEIDEAAAEPQVIPPPDPAKDQ